VNRAGSTTTTQGVTAAVVLSAGSIGVGLGWGGLLVGPRTALVVLAMAALAALLAQAGRRLSAPFAALALVAGLVVPGLLLAGLPATDAPGALIGGWARLLDTTVPAPATGERLLLVATSVGAAAAAGQWLLARTTSRWLPLAPLLALLLGLRLLGTRGGAGSQALPAIALALTAVVFVLLRGGDVGGGRLLVAGGTAAAVAAAAVASVLVLPHRAPLDLAAQRTPAVIPVDAVNPLSLIKGASGSSVPVANVTLRAVSGAAWPGDEPLHLRLAALDTWERGTLTGQASFSALGSVVPDPPSSSPSSTVGVEEQVRLLQPQGPWLPLPDRPVRILAASQPLAVDRGSGAVVVAAGRGPAAGDFTVRSEVAPAPDDAQLGTAQPDPRARALASTVPGTPAGLVQLAHQLVGQDGAGPFVQIGRLQQWFETTFTVDPAAHPGHSIPQLQAFILDSKMGTSEQFASAFVLLARAVGLPARVAVGYTSRVGVGQQVLTQGDLQAWPEIALTTVAGRSLGWVAFEPTPGHTSHDIAVAQPTTAAARAASRAASDPSSVTRSSPVAATPPARARSHFLPFAVAAALLVMLGGALGGTTVVRRRRRKGGGSPTARVSLAWADARRLLRSAGLALPSAATAAEVAAAARTRLGHEAGEVVSSLAQLQTLAVFAPAGLVQQGQADQAWAARDALAHHVRTRTSRWNRLRAGLPSLRAA